MFHVEHLHNFSYFGYFMFGSEKSLGKIILRLFHVEQSKDLWITLLIIRRKGMYCYV